MQQRRIASELYDSPAAKPERDTAVKRICLWVFWGLMCAIFGGGPENRRQKRCTAKVRTGYQIIATELAEKEASDAG
jgi:hypothetical protein